MVDDNSQSPHETHLDPLLDCLVLLTKLYGNPQSRATLCAGLPLKNNRLTPSLFSRAAKQGGFASRLVQRPLWQISNLVLPAILVLNSDNACVITRIDHSNHTLEVVFPEAGTGSETLSFEQFEDSYSGYAIFVKPKHSFEQRADEHNLKKPESWFWGTLRRYKHNYIQIIVASLLVNIFVIASPLFVMNVYDRVIPNSAIDTLWALALGISLVYIFDFLLRSLRGYLIDVTGKKADTLLASMLYQQALGIRMEAKPASTGGFANNLHGYEGIRDFFTSATLAGLVDLPFILIFLWAIWHIGGPLVIVPLLAIPLTAIFAILFEIPMRRAVESAHFGNTQKHALLVESISNLETIKSLSAEGQLQSKWERYISMVAAASLKSRFFSGLVVNFTQYVVQMVTVVTVIAGVYIIKDGNLTMGGLIACTILSGRCLAPLGQIANIITRYQQSKLGLESLDQVMQLPTERPKDTTFVHRPDVEGKIEFKDVSFSYPKQKVQALNNISFTINPGEHVGIIGRIGSGKTTLQKLALGLYQAQDGSIRIDGTDLAQIDPADLRRSIGYVGQDASLFYGNVRENLRTAAPWADDEAILRAATIAGVERFVKKHPSGYDMPTGERGEGVSGGQRQAIAIARALLTNPQILLFDEPTSAMDNTSESEFINQMKSYLPGKTLLLVTHKRAMLELAERIIIVDGGTILADGPKEQVFEALQNRKIKTTDL